MRTAAGRAAARLAAAVLLARSGSAPAVLTAAVAVLQALLGPDQSSEVVRTTLLAVRGLAMELAAADAAAAATAAAGGAVAPPPLAPLLEPHFPALVPSMCAVLAGGVGSAITRSTAEAALQKLLRVDASAAGLDVAARYVGGGGLAAVARTTLTDSFLRRLQKLTDEDLFSSEEY